MNNNATSATFNAIFEETMAKYRSKADDTAKADREALAAEIGQAVADAMAAQETARAEATDPETIRRLNLGKMYSQTPQKPAPEL